MLHCWMSPRHLPCRGNSTLHTFDTCARNVFHICFALTSYLDQHNATRYIRRLCTYRVVVACSLCLLAAYTLPCCLITNTAVPGRLYARHHILYVCKYLVHEYVDYLIACVSLGDEGVCVPFGSTSWKKKHCCYHGTNNTAVTMTQIRLCL